MPSATSMHRRPRRECTSLSSIMHRPVRQEDAPLLQKTRTRPRWRGEVRDPLEWRVPQR